jgi:hypothetical protein
MKTKLTIFEILKVSWTVYSKHFLHMAAICALAFAPVVVAIQFIPMPSASYSDLIGMTPEQLQAIMSSSMIILGLYMLFVPLCASAVTSVAATFLSNGKVTAEGILDASLARWGRLIWTTVLYGSIVFLSAFLVIPAVFFGIAFCFYPNAIALNGSGGFASLKGSHDAVKGRWFRTLGFLIFTNILSIGASMLLGYALSWIPYNIVTIIVTSLLGQLVATFFTVAKAVWFLNKVWSREAENKAAI